jgi:conserved hypothetical protein
MSSSLFKPALPAEEPTPALSETTATSTQNSTQAETKIALTAATTAIEPIRVRKKYTRLVTVLLRAACALALLAYVFTHTSWSDILQNIRHADDGELLIGCIVGLAGVVISSYQWQSLLASEQMHFDLRQLINYYFIGITFNHFLPTGMGGDVVKAYYTGKVGHNAVGATSAVIISRVAGFIGMLLIAFTALIIWHSLFPRSFINAFMLAALAMSSALVFVSFAAGLLPRYAKGHWAEQSVIRSMLKMSEALHKGMKQPRSLCTAIAYGMLFHTSAALNYYSFALMLDIHIPFAFFLVAIPFVSLIAVLPISLNGYGLRETAFVNVFSTMHVHPSTALALALLVDAQMLLFALAGGYIYLSTGKRKGRLSGQVAQQDQA